MSSGLLSNDALSRPASPPRAGASDDEPQRVAAAAPELLVCDEAHRLRNARDGSQTLEALKLVDAPMRVLLTGTPVQNDLDEYAAVMDFACPGLLGDAAEFIPFDSERGDGGRGKNHESDDFEQVNLAI